MKRVAVFCASSPGKNPAFKANAEALGRAMARDGLGLVYGGGKVGLMGVIADAVLSEGGEVIGVIPHALVAKEVEHRGLTELHEVGSMHERKALMESRADAFVAMPGGFGTLDELCEIVTWAQLGFHRKPIGLLNVAGYYDAFLAFLDHGVSEGMISARVRAEILVDSDPERLLAAIRARKPGGPIGPIWLRDKSEL